MAYLSLYEGFGLPPLEAMACGTIAITGNLTSLPEVVGSAAITVDPYSTGAIAEAIVELVNHPSLRSDLKRRSLEQTRAFTWESAAAGIERVLADAIAN
jgi:glycosyltransferase involved in cell wall biosynthesis